MLRSLLHLAIIVTLITLIFKAKGHEAFAQSYYLSYKDGLIEVPKGWRSGWRPPAPDRRVATVYIQTVNRPLSVPHDIMAELDLQPGQVVSVKVAANIVERRIQLERRQ